MSDLIDRQATIDTLDKHLRTTDVPVSYPGIISALTEWLNELPSAQADSKELSGTHKALDTVSRQAVIDALHMHLMYRMGTDSNKKRLDDWINGVPSAQPEPLSDAYTKAVWTWLLDYQIKAAELKGRYTPYEVLSWVANDWRKQHERTD